MTSSGKIYNGEASVLKVYSSRCSFWGCFCEAVYSSRCSFLGCFCEAVCSSRCSFLGCFGEAVYSSRCSLNCCGFLLELQEGSVQDLKFSKTGWANRYPPSLPFWLKPSTAVVENWLGKSVPTSVAILAQAILAQICNGSTAVCVNGLSENGTGSSGAGRPGVQGGR